MRNYMACLLALIAGLVSCTKDKPEEETINTAESSIYGKYTPAGSLYEVRAIHATSGLVSKAVLDSSGFNIKGLEAGLYSVIFQSTPDFIAPDTASVFVNEGESVDMGTIQVKMIDKANIGSLSGNISPSNAATRIMITDAYDNVIKSATIVSGRFTIDSLPAITHFVKFLPTAGFTSPVNLKATVVAKTNTDLGTITIPPLVFEKKAIDTITGLVYISSAVELNNFITRASYDSAIVFTGSLLLYLTETSPELAVALNKIISVKQRLSVAINQSSSIYFNGLKEVGTLEFSGTLLQKVHLGALEKITAGLRIANCSSLTDLDIHSLQDVSGSLTLQRTGFTNFSLFRNVRFKTSYLTISSNEKLESISGLNFTADSLYECLITYNILLTDLDGLQPIKRFRTLLQVSGNTVLASLKGLDNAIYAKRVIISVNPKLTDVCPAKKLINVVKDTAAWQERKVDGLGRWYTETIQPLVAITNGAYDTKEKMLTAISQCP